MMTQEGRGRPALLQAALDSLRVPDLRNKIIFTFAMLAIYRLVAQVPLPGVDQGSLDNLFDRIQLLGFLLSAGGSHGYTVHTHGLHRPSQPVRQSVLHEPEDIRIVGVHRFP